jgi:hypothetical protein
MPTHGHVKRKDFNKHVLLVLKLPNRGSDVETMPRKMDR